MRKVFFFLLIILVCIFLFRPKKSVYNLLKDVQDDYAFVDKYYIYGNHLNIYGSASISGNVSMVLKSINEEIEIPINYDGEKFFVSEFINDGIYLDNIPIDDYLIFLKSVDGDSIKYYSLINNSSYNDTLYYTVTCNDKNNLININFSSKNSKKYMMLSSHVSSVFDNYYDVIIDPGHGGDDPGASFSNHTEAQIVLDLALKLKSSLEGLGLKVGLTRDSDFYPNTYGVNSRTSLPYESHAKYFISLHLNSTDDVMRYGGIEVYAPNNSNLSFASSLAKNIVDSADISYSVNEAFNVGNGVYIRTFTSSDINNSIDDANADGYSPYPITTDTNYYFMIRETGGIVTGAYVDGRDKDYGKNLYYDSNVGAESYLLELGYINYWGDLNNLLDNSNLYIDGIVNAFKEELKCYLNN